MIGSRHNKVLYEGFVRVERDRRTGNEFVWCTNSVAILMWIKDRDQVVFVSQERPAMVTDENPRGDHVELPAGRFDHDTDIMSLAVKEAFEETGIRLAPSQVHLLNHGSPLALAPGVLTEKMYLAYAEVDSSLVDYTRTVFGLSSEGERTERILVPTVRLSSMPFCSMSTMAAVNWFLREREKGGKL